MDDEKAARNSIFHEYLDKLDPGVIRSFLTSHQKPCWESDLLTHLLPELNLVSGSALEMYRCHFALFHRLYLLADELYCEDFYLHVHFMSIHLIKFPETGHCRHYSHDYGRFCREIIFSENTRQCEFHHERTLPQSIECLSERYFYLDWENFFAVNEETAESFISGAWNLLCNYEDLVDCYKILDLPENSNLKVVKMQFRNLAKKFHPDLNPDFHQEFSRINSAYRRLIGYLTVRKDGF